MMNLILFLTLLVVWGSATPLLAITFPFFSSPGKTCQKFFLEYYERRAPYLRQEVLVNKIPPSPKRFQNLQEVMMAYSQGVEPDLENPLHQKLFEVYALSRFMGTRTSREVQYGTEEYRPSMARYARARIQVSQNLNAKPSPELTNYSLLLKKEILKERARLLEIETNLSYWAFIADITTQLRSDVTDIQSQILAKLNLIVPEPFRQQIRNTELSPNLRLSLLFGSLKRLQEKLASQNQILDFVNAALLNTLSISGFMESKSLHLLEEGNATERSQVLIEAAQARDEFAIQMGFEKGYAQALAELPTRESLILDSREKLQDFLGQQQSLQDLKPDEFLMLRPLSRAEKTFARFLITRSEDLRSFDSSRPSRYQSYTYFTLTREDGSSSGLVQVLFHLPGKEKSPVDISTYGIPATMVPVIETATRKILQQSSAKYAYKTPNNPDVKKLASITILDPSPSMRVGNLPESLDVDIYKLGETLRTSNLESDKIEYIRLTAYLENKGELDLYGIHRQFEFWFLDSSSSPKLKAAALEARLNFDRYSHHRLDASDSVILAIANMESKTALGIYDLLFPRVESQLPINVHLAFQSHRHTDATPYSLKDFLPSDLFQTLRDFQFYPSFKNSNFKKALIANLAIQSKDIDVGLAPIVLKILSEDKKVDDGIKNAIQKTSKWHFQKSLALWWYNSLEGSKYWSPHEFKKWDKSGTLTDYLERHSPSFADHLRRWDCSSCFPSNTLINTATGIKNIQNIKVGDLVFTYDSNNQRIDLERVNKLMIHDNRPLLEVIFENGIILNVTPEHPFYSVKQQTYLRISEMSPQDLVSVLEEGRLKNLRIQSIRSLPHKETVYNFEVNRTHTYFVHGILVHNMMTKE